MPSELEIAVDQTIQIIPPGEEVVPSLTLADLDPTPLLRRPAVFPEWRARLRDAILAELKEADPTTETGQEKIKSAAYRVARFKTTIDTFGMNLTEDWRKATEVVNKQRKQIKDSLEGLQAEIKKPMEDYLAAEAARKARVAALLTALEGATRFEIGTTAADMSARLEKLKAFEIEEAVFQAEYHRAVALKVAALPALDELIAKAKKDEAEKAELEQLRREKAEREAAQAREAAAAAAAARRAQEAAEAEARAAAAQAAAAEAAAKARDEAVARGAAEAEAAEAAAKAAEEAKAAAVAAEDYRRAQEAEFAARLRERRRAAEAAIRDAMVREADISPDQADLIILGITTGDIPHLTLTP